MSELLPLWFGFVRPVDRRTYFLSGVGLMVLKYLLDAGLVYAATGVFHGPQVFFNPIFSMRQDALSPAPEWILGALVLFALPFAWIGASMSLRRAIDAGAFPWLALAFFVPGLNYFLMVGLSLLPSALRTPEAPPPPGVDHRLRSAFYGVAAAVGVALVMTGFSVYGLKEYGSALFFISPVAMGVVASYLHNRRFPRKVGETVLIAMLSVIVAGGLLLLFAVEGVFCLAMAAPFAFFFALLGALLGRALALFTRGQGGGPLLTTLLALPLVAAAEASLRTPEIREVTTAVEIDAPPEWVWPNVIAFSPLDPPAEWFFKMGIAYPTGATISGTGVGAIRRCDFSTGPFIEPITAWDEPRRLAFDVAAMPPSMQEWSPYQQLNAPHLEGYLVSHKGEFRLIPLPGGRTRLEGSTFYSMDFAPEAYWRVWAEWLLHSIHQRVLNHIAAKTEAQARANSNNSP